MSGKRAGITGEGSGQMTATLQTMAASVARIESALDRRDASLVEIIESLDRIRAAMAAPPSGGIDHDDAKALRRMAEGSAQMTVTHDPRPIGRIAPYGLTREALNEPTKTRDLEDGPHTDQPAPTVDRAPESEGERVPWWRRPW